MSDGVEEALEDRHYHCWLGLWLGARSQTSKRERETKMTRPGSKHQHQQPHQQQQQQQPSMALSRSLYRSLICHVNFERAARDALGGRDRGRERAGKRRTRRATQEVTRRRTETEADQEDRVEQRKPRRCGKNGIRKRRGRRWKMKGRSVEDRGGARHCRYEAVQAVGQTSKLKDTPWRIRYDGSSRSANNLKLKRSSKKTKVTLDGGFHRKERGRTELKKPERENRKSGEKEDGRNRRISLVLQTKYKTLLEAEIDALLMMLLILLVPLLMTMVMMTHLKMLHLN